MFLKKRLLPLSLAAALAVAGGTSTAGFQLIVGGGSTFPSPPSTSSPLISAVTPTTLDSSSGGVVVISGSDLIDGASVFVGSKEYVGASSGSDLQVVAGAHPYGLVDVTVTNSDGGTDTLTDAIEYTISPAVSAVTADRGKTAGGETVILSGTGLIPGTTVAFDGVPATGVTHIDDSTLQAVTPAHVAGLVDLTITNQYDAYLLNGGFEYVDPASIALISPVEGPQAGGNQVEITGAAFTDVSDVLVDGVSVAYVINNDSSISMTMPAHAEGAVDVLVASPYGNDTSVGGYSYAPLVAAITSISPSIGSVNGGDTITILGESLDGAVVTFDGLVAAEVSNDGSTLVVTSPAHPATGLYDVVISGDHGSVTLTDGFQYAAPPAITAVSPSAGSTDGLAGVELTGARFRADVQVYIDGAAASFVRNTNQSITVDMPAHAAGFVDIMVEDQYGSSVASNAFEYGIAPTLTSIDDLSGNTDGGEPVVLTGTGFSVDTQVFFGASEATVQFDSATQLTATTPASVDQGLVDVTVSNTYGSDTLVSEFRYKASPVITSITPAFGSVDGGDTIIITADNLATNNVIRFGGPSGTHAASITKTGDNELTVVTPAHAEGLTDIYIKHYTGNTVHSDVFEFIGAPAITSVDPIGGNTVGGNTVTINGTGFRDGTSVTFAGTPATDVTVVNSTTMTVTAPAGPGTGGVDVVVTNAYGSNTLGDGYWYKSSPVITSITPNTGSVDGGDTIVINGSDFASGNWVYFDGVEAPSVTVNGGQTQLTVTTPAHATGLVDVSVWHWAGETTSVGAFEYKNGPDLVSISPLRRGVTGGTVNLTGTNFTPDTVVKVDGATAASTYNGTTSLSITAPAHAAGTVDLEVSNAYGSDVLSNALTYVAAPTITSVSPANGDEAGGNTVTITGTGFTPQDAIAVYFSGVQTANATYVSPTEITAIAPAGTGGETVSVTISNQFGSDVRANAYTYDAPVQPLTASLVKLSNGGGNGASSAEGNLQINVSGGVEPYTYYWQEVGSKTLAISPVQVTETYDCGVDPGPCYQITQDDPTCSTGNWVSTTKSDVYVYLGSGSGTNCNESGSGGSGSFRLSVVDAVGTQVTTNSVSYSFVGW